jgi:phosphatidylserine/phosphatidylglycerophosphate/cardiolipin synthase-like enzyme
VTERAWLTGVSLPILEQLRRLLTSGRIAGPLTTADLQANGLGAVAEVAGSVLGLPVATGMAVLDAVLAERRTQSGPRVDLVWTGPEPRVSPARDTAVALRELLAGAQRTVLVAGFRFDHGAEILEPLASAIKSRGVAATVFLDIPPAPIGADPALHAVAVADQFVSENWPFTPAPPQLYYDPRTVRPGSRQTLHAKCAVADNLLSLVTSANFTNRGQTRNIEVGVLIEDHTFASMLSGQWLGLINSGLMVKVEPSRP